MLRRVSSTLRCTVLEPASVELQVAVAAAHAVDGSLAVTLDGRPVHPTEHPGAAGGRLHLLQVPPGELAVSYVAAVRGTSAPVPVEPLDASTYLRPSRYAESDRLAAVATATFDVRADPATLVRDVAAFVGTRLSYESGSSTGTDGAVDTLLAGRGVCRDFAHLTVALLRALDVPARLVSVYAPGLLPMDFHAVAEALVDGAWHVVDATLLAPRASLVRIATGRDAADTAFLSTYGGQVRFEQLAVTAVVDGELPVDEPARLVQLA